MAGKSAILTNNTHKVDKIIIEINNTSRGFKMADMYNACREGKLHEIERICSEGYDVDSVNLAGHTPLICAAINGQVAVVRYLIQEAGANVHLKSKVAYGQSALHFACERGQLEVVRTLIDLGAFIDGRDDVKRTPLMVAADWAKYDVACFLIKAGADTKTLDEDRGGKLLLSAINDKHNHPDLVSVMLDRNIGATVRVLQDHHRHDLYMNAAKSGYDKILKYFVLHSPSEFVDHKDRNGYTALYYAARNNHLQCGILLAEAGADLTMSVQNPEQGQLLPLDMASPEFKDAILHTLSFNVKKTICIIGKECVGKSSLIASLQNENAPLLKKVFHWMFGVKNISDRTAGIEPVPLSSKRYGDVVFFDFAGQGSYHGPHEMFLESFINNRGSTVTIVLVVKATDDEEDISQQLERWLHPVSKAPSSEIPIQVIVVGSHWDKVKSKEQAREKLERCYSIVKDSFPADCMNFQDVCYLNCCQPYSSDIQKLCMYLNAVPVPRYKATDCAYSICWVISRINKTIKKKAIQVVDLGEWIIDNKSVLPTNLPPAEEVCKDLSSTGHFLYIPNRVVSNGWLILDLPAILHEVYGTLFSPKTDSCIAGNEFGLVSRQKIKDLFPKMNCKMVRDVLIALEFCIEVDSAILKKLITSDKIQDDHCEHLFFPSLVQSKSPEIFQNCTSSHSLCWQFEVDRKYYISPLLLQTTILRMAAEHAFFYQHGPNSRVKLWSVWREGIFWQSTTEDVDVAVQVHDNRVIQVIGKSLQLVQSALCSYISTIAHDIFSTVRKLSPNLSGFAYIIHPADPQVLLNNPISRSPEEMFPATTVLEAISKNKDTCLSLTRQRDTPKAERVYVTTLFCGCKPPLDVAQKLCFKNLNAPLLIDPLLTTPIISELQRLVVQSIAPDWYTVGIHLEIETSLLDIIQADHPYSVEGCCCTMFTRWLACNGGTGEEPRVWRTVLKALKNAGHMTLVGDVERTLFACNEQK